MTDHHALAWDAIEEGDSFPCTHDWEREGCTGCAHDAALRADTARVPEGLRENGDGYLVQTWVELK